MILTRNSAISFLTSLTVAPITSTIRDIPTEVYLDPYDDGVLIPSVVNLDNVQTVPKHKLGPLITKLTSERMEEVEKALCFALGVDAYVKP